MRAMRSLAAHVILDVQAAAAAQLNFTIFSSFSFLYEHRTPHRPARPEVNAWEFATV